MIKKNHENGTYNHSYPVRRLPTKAKHDGVHPSWWYAADYEVDGIESHEVSPYSENLQNSERTARKKTKLDNNLNYFRFKIQDRQINQKRLLHLQCDNKGLQPNTSWEGDHRKLFHLAFLISICMDGYQENDDRLRLHIGSLEPRKAEIVQVSVLKSMISISFWIIAIAEEKITQAVTIWCILFLVKRANPNHDSPQGKYMKSK